MEKWPVIYLGTDKSPPPVRELRAGKLDCIYVDGALRHIRAGEKEILRMIYPAVRDHNWGTVPCRISREEIQLSEDSFTIRYEGRYTSGNIDYLTTIHLSGNTDNTLTISMQGEALSDFKKNRIGLNILHPAEECAGRECKVVTHAGEEYSAVFPFLISPDQPVKNIRSLAWTGEDGSSAMLGFSGEVFEMEDQRNWTDASYKTYCTPLELPFPVAVRKGENLKQEVILQVMVSGEQADAEDICRVSIPETATRYPFPSIGLARSSETGRIHPEDMVWIKKAGFRHYRIDLRFYEEGWREVLESGLEEAAAMGLEIELALFFDTDFKSQLNSFLTEVQKHDRPLVRILVFARDHIHDSQLSEAVIPVLKKDFRGTLVGTGTNANFAELNRNRPGTGLPDFLVYSINPQVHAFDPLTLVENLQGQAYTVQTARSFAGGKPICVSPVTLKPRFNAVATSEEQDEEAGLPSRYDPRQASLFCAGWLLGSLRYLSGSGVQSITYFETIGRGGIIHGRQAAVSPDFFPARSSEIYPVYFLMKEILKYSDCLVLPVESSHPLRFSSLMMEGMGQRILGLASHVQDKITINLPGDMIIAESWVLDEDTMADLRRGGDPRQILTKATSITLNPYAVALLTLR